MKTIDKISIVDIRNLSDNVKIEARGASPERLIELNNRLQYLDLIVTISIDMRILTSNTQITGLNILAYLPNIQSLRLNAVLTEPVNEMDVFKTLSKLKELAVYGYFKKNISFEPIEHLINLKKLLFENGLSKKQQLIIEKFSSLTSLSVSDLDLMSFPINKNLKQLTIFRKLSYASDIFRVFPNIVELDLENCKEIVDFSFIANFQKLKSLTFRYMKQLESFPNIHKLAKLKSISLINMSNLRNIDLIWENIDLIELMVTEIKFLKIEDFYRLKEFKSLKTVYLTFKDQKENKKAQEFVLENNWIYRQPGL